MDLTFKDYNEKIAIETLLQYAGCQKDRKKSSKGHPLYVSDGESRKFVVNIAKNNCFEAGVHGKTHTVTGFIYEHPTMFKEYQSGMKEGRLIHLVCSNILNINPELATTLWREEAKKRDPFKIEGYSTISYKDNPKAFIPYFKNRGLWSSTAQAFSDFFFLSTRKDQENKYRPNMSFPLRMPSKPEGPIVGLELRGCPNRDNKVNYKGLAQNSNSAEGLWVADLGHNLPAEQLVHPRQVLWFESAYDAMAYYQLHRKQYDNDSKFSPTTQQRTAAAEKLRLLDQSIFVSSSGVVTEQSSANMLAAHPDAMHHLCFDNDEAGRRFCAVVLMKKGGRESTISPGVDGFLHITDFSTNSTAKVPLDEDFNIEDISKALNVPMHNIVRELPDPRFKDWNDQVLNKPMQTPSTEESKTESQSNGRHM